MDQETHAEIKSLRDFLEKNMLNREEIEQRFEMLVTKDDVLELRQDLSSLKAELNDRQN